MEVGKKWDISVCEGLCDFVNSIFHQKQNLRYVVTVVEITAARPELFWQGYSMATKYELHVLMGARARYLGCLTVQLIRKARLGRPLWFGCFWWGLRAPLLK